MINGAKVVGAGTLKQTLFEPYPADLAPDIDYERDPG